MWVGTKGVEKPFIYRAFTAATTFGSISWDCVLLIKNVLYCSSFRYSRSSVSTVFLLSMNELSINILFFP